MNKLFWVGLSIELMVRSRKLSSKRSLESSSSTIAWSVLCTSLATSLASGLSRAAWRALEVYRSRLRWRLTYSHSDWSSWLKTGGLRKCRAKLCPVASAWENC